MRVRGNIQAGYGKDLSCAPGPLMNAEPVSWSTHAWHSEPRNLLAPGKNAANAVRPSTVVPCVAGGETDASQGEPSNAHNSLLVVEVPDAQVTVKESQIH